MGAKKSNSRDTANKAIVRAAKIRAKKNNHGNKGEKLVLGKLKKKRCYKKVFHASMQNNKLGYDIKTTDRNDKEEFHEVKSSSKKKFSPSTWHIAKKQYDTARRNFKKYFFWFVNALNTKTPIIKKLSPGQMKFTPSRYQVTVSDNYDHKTISLNASSLIEAYENISKSSKTNSVRTNKSQLEDRQLIAQSVLTRQFLGVNLNNKEFKDIDCNYNQGNSRKPYHIKYTDKKGKLVYVDIQVRFIDSISSTSGNTFRLHVTKHRLDQARKLKPDSKSRREFWYCVLDKASKKLFVNVYDVSGPEFWDQNATQIDYYRFTEKRK
jgi:hypothetical protein